MTQQGATSIRYGPTPRQPIHCYLLCILRNFAETISFYLKRLHRYGVCRTCCFFLPTLISQFDFVYSCSVSDQFAERTICRTTVLSRTTSLVVSSIVIQCNQLRNNGSHKCRCTHHQRPWPFASKFDIKHTIFMRKCTHVDASVHNISAFQPKMSELAHIHS